MAKKKIFLKISSMIGTAKPSCLRGILPQEKSAKECFIAREFAKVQRIGGYSLADIESSPDDSEGKADVIAKLNGAEVGIQLTELKIAHRPQSSDRASKIIDKLLELILTKVNPPYPVFVDVRSPLDYQNASIKLTGKKIGKLATIIADAIVSEQFSPSIDEYFGESRVGLQLNPLEIPPQIEPTISRIEISKIPEGHTTLCQGKDNVHINFNFDVVVTSAETYESLARTIYQKKHNAHAPILLVWSYDQDFWGEEEGIAQMFRERSDNSPFDYIYLFFFINAEKLFEANRKVIVVKEKALTSACPRLG